MVTKQINNKFQEQKRWNDVIGREGLERMRRDPTSYDASKFKYNLRVTHMLKQLDNIQGKTILDLGCGKGIISVTLAMRGANVSGIDIGPDLISLANELANINNVECDFHVGSIDKLPFPDNSFDHVVGSAIMHHLPRYAVQDSIAEAYRVLKPGGTLMLSEPIENSRLFEFLQNLIPVGTPGRPNRRPSILQRKLWKEFLENADDRAMQISEFKSAAKPFALFEYKYFGMTARLARIIPAKAAKQFFDFIDKFLTHKLSPLRWFSRSVLVTYRK